ncbi:lysophospholipid acyltransferase family protein [Pelistega europaea]|uniref:1-acyl-sn-glycerol-3-phosphate acyltransferase n=1 Tax=Pelistega europaea TaxID=106147 RepID=A0A7Y4L9M7_9BURK|nr:lysophospholipid acyltransferase family protein [Pelistega europaea]NOL49488.1 1-acyl-sn-glycerol-3-phosphate acyltransferase [Pelistega europaea]
MLGTFLSSLTKIMIGAYPYWRHSKPSTAQRVYFANHSSHLDTMTIWSSLDADLRRVTRPVAAKDYWGKGGIRGIIARDALNVVLIERSGQGEEDPLAPLYEALDQGDSLIIFPEGTRRYEAEPAAFKSGLYHLSRKYPHIEYIPVYLDNTRRSLPKGALLPLPVSCMATFGAPLEIDLSESKEHFLERARQAVIDLSKPEGALPQDFQYKKEKAADKKEKTLEQTELGQLAEQEVTASIPIQPVVEESSPATLSESSQPITSKKGGEHV